jgi:hypothetical protein
MKDLALKSLFLLSVFVMVDYILMIAVGCVSSIMGFTADYYNCAFCDIGKSVMLVSSILFIIVIMPDIKSLVKRPKLD